MYRFFGKHVLGEPNASKFHEQDFRVEKLADLLVLHNRKLPDNALSPDQLLEEWIDSAKRQNEKLTAELLRERLSYVLAADWPTQILSEKNGDQIFLSRAG